MGVDQSESGEVVVNSTKTSAKMHQDQNQPNRPGGGSGLANSSPASPGEEESSMWKVDGCTSASTSHGIIKSGATEPPGSQEISSSATTSARTKITTTTTTAGTGILNMFSKTKKGPSKSSSKSDQERFLPTFKERKADPNDCMRESLVEGKSMKNNSNKPLKNNYASHESPSSSTLYFLLVVLVKFFLLLSVLGLLLATLLWFHVRLTALETESWSLRQIRGHPGERSNAHEKGEFFRSGDQILTRFLREKYDTEENKRIVSDSSGTVSAPYYDNVSPDVPERQQRVKRRVDSASGGQQRERSRSSNPNLSGYNVEFINPKVREDMEKAGGGSPIEQTAGSSASQQESSPNANTVPDDDWVWLTSYSRIPRYILMLHKCERAELAGCQTLLRAYQPTISCFFKMSSRNQRFNALLFLLRGSQS